MSDESTIVPNPLSDFASSNYALTLYVIDKQNYKALSTTLNTVSINSLPKNLKNKIIIAESGVTSIQITNLSIDTIPLVTQGSMATTIKMDITQTRGSNLIDKIYAIAQYCGWESPFEMCYLLEIRFLGLDDTNQNAANISTITLPIMFTGVNVNISHSSSVYNIDAVYANAVTNDHSYSRVPENMTVSSGSNLEDFFNNFSNKLNEIERQKVDFTNFNLPTFTHRFVVPTGSEEYFGIDFRTFNVGEPANNTSSKNNQSLYAYSSSQNEVVATANSTIQSFVDNVLRYVDEIQEKLVSDELFTTTYVIDPWLEVDKFDKLSGKETYLITWYIIPAVRRKYVRNATSNNLLEQDAISQLRTVKLYDYYHTGLNSEVRDIQFKLNNLYHAKIVQYQSDFSSFLSVGQNPQVLQNTANNILRANINASINQQELSLDELQEIENVDDDGNVYSYAEDIQIRDGNFFFYEPKMSSNPSMQQNATFNPSYNRALQYKEDLDFIRNAVKFSFLECDMKIKGDPYWLLPPNVAITASFNNGLDSTNTRDYRRENVALVRFNYPTNDYYDEDNTIVDSELNVFSAFYYIKSVTSTFHNGKFEQHLTGIRETKISLERIKQYLREHNIS